MDIMSIGDCLRSIRLKLGVSQERAAELCDISEKTYGKLERGQANVSLKVINKVAGGLGLCIVVMIRGPVSEKSGVWEYFAVLEPCFVQDSPTEMIYAIMACKNTAMGRYIVATVHGVSTNPDFVSDIVDSFNSYMLSPTHLVDAIYDMLF